MDILTFIISSLVVSAGSFAAAIWAFGNQKWSVDVRKDLATVGFIAGGAAFVVSIWFIVNRAF